jgi:hypothetical protein
VVGYREKSERIAALVSADPDIDDLPLWQELWQEYADHLDSLAGFFGPSLLELARFSVDDGFPTSLNLHEGVLELHFALEISSGDTSTSTFDSSGWRFRPTQIRRFVTGCFSGKTPIATSSTERNREQFGMNCSTTDILARL